MNYRPGSGITVGGERFELLQFHFHTPSEHQIVGRPAAIEAHFVHKNAAGQLAVVGVMIEPGQKNLAMSEIWAHLPKKAGSEKIIKQVVINGFDLLPTDTTYYRYMGSLTTPPCSEGVNWYVLHQPIQADVQQIQQLAQAVGENARPVQALNHRLLVAPGAVN